MLFARAVPVAGVPPSTCTAENTWGSIIDDSAVLQPAHAPEEACACRPPRAPRRGPSTPRNAPCPPQPSPPAPAVSPRPLTSSRDGHACQPGRERLRRAPQHELPVGARGAELERPPRERADARDGVVVDPLSLCRVPGNGIGMRMASPVRARLFLSLERTATRSEPNQTPQTAHTERTHRKDSAGRSTQSARTHPGRPDAPRGGGLPPLRLGLEGGERLRELGRGWVGWWVGGWVWSGWGEWRRVIARLEGKPSWLQQSEHRRATAPLGLPSQRRPTQGRTTQSTTQGRAQQNRAPRSSPSSAPSPPQRSPLSGSTGRRPRGRRAAGRSRNPRQP